MGMSAPVYYTADMVRAMPDDGNRYETVHGEAGRDAPEPITRVAAIPTHPGRHAMARWPRRAWTTLFTYATIFLLFPLLCFLAYAWVRGWF